MAISLSQGMRLAVYSMGDIQNSIDISNKRLATGKKVNSALDNASSYFAAQSYRNEGDKLTTLLDGMNQARLTIDKANKAIDGGIKLLQSADSLARSAQQSANDTDRTNYQAQVAELLNQVVKLFSDSGFNGKQLLVNDTQTGANLNSTLAQLSVSGVAAEKAVYDGGLLTVQTNTATSNFTSIVFKPIDVRMGAKTVGSGLDLTSDTTNNYTGFGTALGPTPIYVAGGLNVWSVANAATVDRFRTKVAAAINTLQAAGATIATQVATLDIRIQYTKDTSRINYQAADNLTVADMNEEGANLSSLQTKQQLAVQALSLASKSDQAILRLF